MGPAFYVLAILGCGEADAACEPVAVAPARYESIEACTRDSNDAVMAHQDALYPVVVAQCRRSDEAVAEKLMPEQVDLPEPERKPAIRRALHEVPQTQSI